MNINKLIEKRSMDFDLTKAKNIYNDSKSFNKELMYNFINKIINEINNEYANVISIINLTNKADPLNVYNMAITIGNKEMLSNSIINNRKEEFEFKHKKEFTISDIDFMFEAYATIIRTVAKEYTSLRKDVFTLVRLVKEAKENTVNEF